MVVMRFSEEWKALGCPLTVGEKTSRNQHPSWETLRQRRTRTDDRTGPRTLVGFRMSWRHA